MAYYRGDVFWFTLIVSILFKVLCSRYWEIWIIASLTLYPLPWEIHTIPTDGSIYQGTLKIVLTCGRDTVILLFSSPHNSFSHPFQKPSGLTVRVRYHYRQASLVAQMVKNLPAMQETRVRSLGQEDPLEKRMATHSSILAWWIPWAEEPGGLQSMELQRVRHDEQLTHTQEHRLKAKGKEGGRGWDG